MHCPGLRCTWLLCPRSFGLDLLYSQILFQKNGASTRKASPEKGKKVREKKEGKRKKSSCRLHSETDQDDGESNHSEKLKEEVKA